MLNVANVCSSRFKVIPIQHQFHSLHSDEGLSVGEGRRKFTEYNCVHTQWNKKPGTASLYPMSCEIHAEISSFLLCNIWGLDPGGREGVKHGPSRSGKIPTSLETQKCQLENGGTIVHPSNR